MKKDRILKIRQEHVLYNKSGQRLASCKLEKVLADDLRERVEINKLFGQPNSSGYRITDLTVLRPRVGYGTELIKSLFTSAYSYRLRRDFYYVEILNNNQASLEFFKALGFNKIGETHYTTRMIKAI